MTLDDLLMEYEHLLAEHDARKADGQDVSDLEDRALALVDETEHKVDAVAAQLMRLDRFADACVDESERLVARAKTLRNSRRWLSTIAARAMSMRGLKRVQGVRSSMVVTTSRRVEVSSVDALPPDLVSCEFTVVCDGSIGEWLHKQVEALAYSNMASVTPLERKPMKRALMRLLQQDAHAVTGASLIESEPTVRAYISRAPKQRSVDEDDE